MASIMLPHLAVQRERMDQYFVDEGEQNPSVQPSKGVRHNGKYHTPSLGYTKRKSCASRPSFEASRQYHSCGSVDTDVNAAVVPSYIESHFMRANEGQGGVEVGSQCGQGEDNLHRYVFYFCGELG